MKYKKSEKTDNFWYLDLFHLFISSKELKACSFQCFIFQKVFWYHVSGCSQAHSWKEEINPNADNYYFFNFTNQSMVFYFQGYIWHGGVRVAYPGWHFFGLEQCA